MSVSEGGSHDLHFDGEGVKRLVGCLWEEHRLRPGWHFFKRSFLLFK